MKKYNIDKGEVLSLKAIEWFAENSYEEVYLREFGRKLKISPNSAQRFLNLFLKNGWIDEIKKGNLRYFRANLDSITFRYIKIVLSLRGIEISGLIDYLKGKNVTHFILFGSVAKGLNDKNSDFDFVFIGPSKNTNFQEFEKRMNREFQVHFFTWNEWKKQALQNKAFYQDVLKDGIPLIGIKPIVNKNDNR